MVKLPKFWGIHARPTRFLEISLGALPFVVVLVAYAYSSHVRLTENPGDKLLPSFNSCIEAFYALATDVDPRSEEIILWHDTFLSLRRLLSALIISAISALLIGINMGLFPGMYTVLNPILTFISIIPPLAILPIIFISLGVDEISKIFLIILGIAPSMTRDIAAATAKLPREMITKAATLGANQLEIVYRVAMPQIMPRLLEGVRLALGASWLFLIASEAISAQSGLGHRIFLVRRYLAMDIIIPLALWITLLGFLLDTALRLAIKWFFPWYHTDQ